MNGNMVCDGCGGVLVQLGMGLYHAATGSVGCVMDDGVIHATSSPSDDSYQCDLCGAKGRWGREIRVRPISTGLLSEGGTMEILHSEDWAICPCCEADIGAGRREAIVQRSVENFGAPPDRKESVAGLIRELHQAVWAGWDGQIYDSKDLPFGES